MLSACMILLLYPLIADIRKSRFYIGPVLICTLILMGIGIVRGKITLFSVLTGWIPGMMMVIRKSGKNRAFPFIPFLFMAVLLFSFFGR